MDRIGRVLHAGISVYDMEESLAWYEKNLGFRLVKDDGYVPSRWNDVTRAPHRSVRVTCA